MVLDIVNTARPYTEMLYFLAGIILTGTIFVARTQIKEARDQGARSEIRLSREKAIESCRFYFEVFIDKSNDRYEKMKASGYKRRECSKDFSKVVLSSEDCIEILNKSIEFGIVFEVNALEVVASYFVSGVADEKIGFQIIGKTFCDSVHTSFDFIYAVRIDEINQLRYHNCLKLYEIWSIRLEEGDIFKIINELQAKLKKEDSSTLG